MQQQGPCASRYGLENHGIGNPRTVWWNLSTPALYEQALGRYEGMLAHLGPLVVRTGQYTGRSPKDRFIVREPSSQDKIAWGEVNRPFDPERYDVLRKRMLAYLEGKDLFVQDCYVGADPAYQLPLRVVTEKAWHALFARNMFIRELDPAKLAVHQPQFTVINACGFNADPEVHGTHSEAFILLNFGRREALIGGTQYGGEMKKSLLTVMSYLLPGKEVLPMHCSANYGRDKEDTALFFGLSGTGKTTLSADPERTLIGDDEHGWSEKGVFNFEGGCYAKCIRLSRDAEPQIYNAIRYGVVLENVVIDPWTRRLDFNSEEYTENTRAAYRVHFIENAQIPGVGGHPSDVVFLTADAFGVLPPIAKLTPEQAMYHFLSGYTAKLAGTERGLGKEPQAVFSSCFGEPFLPRHPMEYAHLLGEKLRAHHARVWLINTGWTGGAFGTGQRMSLAYTRAMVIAAIEGELGDVPTQPHPVFQVLVPEFCPGVPNEVLDPRRQWADQAAYDAAARDLAGRFIANFEQKFGASASALAGAGPRVQ